MGFLSKLFGRSKSSTDDPFGRIHYDVPAQWSGEIIEDAPGILLLAPEVEANWQANIFVEVRKAAQHRDLADSIDDLIPKLRLEKTSFRLIQKDLTRNRNGAQIGRIEYAAESDGTALTEWELVIPFSKDQQFFILASAPTECWSKYENVFREFVESVVIRSEGI